MAASKTIVVFAILSLTVFCFTSWKNSNSGFVTALRGSLLLAGQGLFLLVLAGCLVSVLYTLLWPSSASPPQSLPEASKEDVRQKQELSRKKQQEKHSMMTSSYQESVLKPRQESMIKQQEERFYRMTGETWRLTQGHTLGESSMQPQEEEGADETPNAQALRRRKLPECATRAPPKPDPPREKRVVVLLEEPSEVAEGVVQVALRCPSGRTVKRRFLKSQNSMVLLDWMQKTGYHPAIYTVCTSYPRRPLQTGKELSLEEVGIDTDTVLNVEKNDPPTS